MTVSFIGHRDTPQEIQPLLTDILTHLIQFYSATKFLVGNQGGFDRMVQSTLRSLQKKFPYIRYYIILAYFPKENNGVDPSDETIYPSGLEKTPTRFAILKRNHWMMLNSDLIIAYVTHPWGGAAQSKDYARKKKKPVINLAKVPSLEKDMDLTVFLD